MRNPLDLCSRVPRCMWMCSPGAAVCAAPLALVQCGSCCTWRGVVCDPRLPRRLYLGGNGGGGWHRRRWQGFHPQFARSCAPLWWGPWRHVLRVSSLFRWRLHLRCVSLAFLYWPDNEGDLDLPPARHVGSALLAVSLPGPPGHGGSSPFYPLKITCIWCRTTYKTSIIQYTNHANF